MLRLTRCLLSTATRTNGPGRCFQIIRVIEEMTGRPVPPQLAAPLVKGAGEIDRVRSGLDDTMRNAYNATREVRLSRPNVLDLRTAAFVVAI